FRSECLFFKGSLPFKPLPSSFLVNRSGGKLACKRSGIRLFSSVFELSPFVNRMPLYREANRGVLDMDALSGKLVGTITAAPLNNMGNVRAKGTGALPPRWRDP